MSERMADPVFRLRCELAESPYWSVDVGELYWVDILAGRIHAGNPFSGTVRLVYQSDRSVSAVRPGVLNDGARVLVAVERDRLSVINGSGTAVDHLGLPTTGHRIRSNDAEPDAHGRLLVGQMEEAGGAGEGRLIRVDSDGATRCLLHDLSVPNGLAWSESSGELLLVDSGHKAVVAYRFEQDTGKMRSSRLYANLENVAGVPDGMAMDERGHLFVAMFGGSHVVEIDCTGQIVGRISVPAEQVTSCAFGGPDGQDLYITTAALANHGEVTPLAGSVFLARMAAGGKPRHRHRIAWATGDSMKAPATSRVAEARKGDHAR